MSTASARVAVTPGGAVEPTSVEPTSVEPTSAEPTFAELVAARADDPGVALWFEDRSWTWRDVVVEARRRAAIVDDPLGRGRRHVARAMENTRVIWRSWVCRSCHSRMRR